MKSFVLNEKSFNFALRCVKLYRHLCDKHKEYVLSKQILKSGTSIGAMIAEGNYAESRADFIHKFSIALKECNETLYWIELLFHSGYIREVEHKSLKVNVEELLRLITSSIVTAKKKNK